MGDVTKQLGVALGKMDVTTISTTMDQFERHFEELDVQSGYMGAKMAETTAQGTPEDDVHALMQQVADEHQLDMSGMMSTGVISPGGNMQQTSLEQRLAALQGK